jgi:hypothetical protein
VRLISACACRAESMTLHYRVVGCLAITQVLTFIVGGLRNDFPFDQIGFGVIRAATNDLLRVRGANSGQSVELFFSRRIKIQEIADASENCA